MEEQLRVLADRAALPNVTLQVVPLKVGAHPGLGSSFALLHFEEDVGDLVYVEGIHGHLFLEGHNDVERYRQAFEELRAVASGPKDSVACVIAVADSYAT